MALVNLGLRGEKYDVVVPYAYGVTTLFRASPDSPSWCRSGATDRPRAHERQPAAGRQAGEGPRLPAVVVSVERRLLAPDTPLPAAADDGWDVLRHVVEYAAQWGIDPARTAVFGESCGALISALAAIRAREADPRLQAQVLVNPAVGVTETMLDHASVTEHANSPTATVPQLQLFHRRAVPPGTDARALSPLHADDLSGLPPALVVVLTHDPVADNGRRHAERLRAAGTPVRLTHQERCEGDGCPVGLGLGGLVVASGDRPQDYVFGAGPPGPAVRFAEPRQRLSVTPCV
ncbi:alpha/beta hydrolase fold domain-containing protein [Streptomyces sp. P1-3]|uniref:alpha/beta hydrolase fold domain-containing protein n=1 Tax=Streptomyces sp. P1-3 TaxID=3421658 RepID=UPI003D364D8B